MSQGIQFLTYKRTMLRIVLNIALLIVMTTLFSDIHHEDKQNLIEHRVPGIMFDEVVYADDTICMSTNEKAMKWNDKQ